MPGSLPHLAARFFDFVTSRPLSVTERDEVERWLNPVEWSPYFAQIPADQRHGLVTARRIAQLHPGRRDLIRAGLLHDIGKRHSELGAWGRSLASLAIKLGLPLSARFSAYRDHGPLGADELDRLGAENLVVVFAREHHGTADPGIPEWAALVAADRARWR